MIILSNGSKWLGQEPDTVEDLLVVMQNHELEDWSSFDLVTKEPHKEFRAFGNFIAVSHVFRIDGSLDEMLPIARAMKENRRKYYRSNKIHPFSKRTVRERKQKSLHYNMHSTG